MQALREYRSVVLTWLAWSLVVLTLVAYLPHRFHLTGPDLALSWTEGETRPGVPPGSPYLSNPMLNGHVAWDSEYYLSLAVAGYDDPASRAISPNFTWYAPRSGLLGEHEGWVSLNYAFFPGYPLVARVFAQPFLWGGQNPIAAATLGAVIVSLLGALAAMLGLFRLGRGLWDADTGRRAAFYLLIAPASMFLAMVYTEGLFLGLSFLALACARDRQFAAAGLLAFGATLTKAAGGLLVVPLVLYWFLAHGKGRAPYEVKPRQWAALACAALPFLAYGLFSLTLGKNFHWVESVYFGRGFVVLGQTIDAWSQALGRMAAEPQAMAYFAVELACLAWAVLSLVWLRKKEPVLVAYGALSLVFSLTSGVAQGMHRYVLALPTVFLLAAAWGRRQAFDRAWILANLPFFFVFLLAYVFNLWAG